MLVSLLLLSLSAGLFSPQETSNLEAAPRHITGCMAAIQPLLPLGLRLPCCSQCGSCSGPPGLLVSLGFPYSVHLPAGIPLPFTPAPRPLPGFALLMGSYCSVSWPVKGAEWVQERNYRISGLGGHQRLITGVAPSEASAFTSHEPTAQARTDYDSPTTLISGKQHVIESLSFT